MISCLERTSNLAIFQIIAQRFFYLSHLFTVNYLLIVQEYGWWYCELFHHYLNQSLAFHLDKGGKKALTGKTERGSEILCGDSVHDQYGIRNYYFL